MLYGSYILTVGHEPNSISIERVIVAGFITTRFHYRGVIQCLLGVNFMVWVHAAY